jgi:hypothetical protein
MMISLPDEIYERLKALASKALVCHYKKTLGSYVEVCGELEWWPVDGGCVPSCSGCRTKQDRDELFLKLKEIEESCV